MKCLVVFSVVALCALGGDAFFLGNGKAKGGISSSVDANAFAESDSFSESSAGASAGASSFGGHGHGGGSAGLGGIGNILA